MNKKPTKIIFLFLIAVSLTGCVNNKMNEAHPTKTETAPIPMASSKIDITNESQVFRADDVFVSEDTVLSDKPFMSINIEDVQNKRGELEKTESTAGSNGHFIYWKADGIVYVTHSSGQELISLFISKDEVSLNCGLKVGMTEAEISQLKMPFEKFAGKDLFDETKSIAFGSFSRYDNSPLNLEGVESVYVYVGAVPESDMIEYNMGTTCISIIAAVKEGVVTDIILDMPTAG